MPEFNDNTDFNALRQVIHTIPDLEIATLIGSRARGDAGDNSDWDIAVRWCSRVLDFMDELGRTENLRNQLAAALRTTVDKVDLVDLNRANLAMRAAVAEEGIVLKGDDDLPWFRFLTRTWRELEDWYWEQEHQTGVGSSKKYSIRPRFMRAMTSTLSPHTERYRHLL